MPNVQVHHGANTLPFLATNRATVSAFQVGFRSGMCSATRGSDMCAKISAGSISDNRTNLISDLIAASFDVLVTHCQLDAISQQPNPCLPSRWDIGIQFVAI
jgi:hypothetical protein